MCILLSRFCCIFTCSEFLDNLVPWMYRVQKGRFLYYDIYVCFNEIKGGEEFFSCHLSYLWRYHYVLLSPPKNSLKLLYWEYTVITLCEFLCMTFRSPFLFWEPGNLCKPIPLRPILNVSCEEQIFHLLPTSYDICLAFPCWFPRKQWVNVKLQFQ